MTPEFVYDRTQSDVDYVQALAAIGWDKFTDSQKAEWLEGKLKGCLNVSDLTRIENAVAEIAGLLGLDIETLTGSLPMYPDSNYFQQLLANVEAIRQGGSPYLHPDTPDVPEQPINTYQKLNDIEKILFDVYDIFTANLKSRYYCGSEIYAGDNIGALI